MVSSAAQSGRLKTGVFCDPPGNEVRAFADLSSWPPHPCFPCPVLPPRLLSTLVPRRTGASFLALPRALFLLRRQPLLSPAPSLIPCCLLCCLLWLPHPSSQPGIRSPVPRPRPQAQHPCEPTVFPGCLRCLPLHPGPRAQPCPAPVAEPKWQMCHSQKWFLPPETFGRCITWHVMHFLGPESGS